ncbi:hypothetical protein AKJ16_DCAP11321, partial [Drosera capensis]
ILDMMETVEGAPDSWGAHYSLIGCCVIRCCQDDLRGIVFHDWTECHAIQAFQFYSSWECRRVLPGSMHLWPLVMPKHETSASSVFIDILASDYMGLATALTSIGYCAFQFPSYWAGSKFFTVHYCLCRGKLGFCDCSLLPCIALSCLKASVTIQIFYVSTGSSSTKQHLQDRARSVTRSNVDNRQNKMVLSKTKKLDEYRKKLDKSLLAPSLVDEEILRMLVKKQILCSADDQPQGPIENLVNKRTPQVSTLLDMLRSGSENYVQSPRKPYASWKVKQDNENFRCMYREGPQGTPIHTLCLDGQADAPLDASICVRNISCHEIAHSNPINGLYVTYETSAYPIAFPDSRFHKVTEEYYKKIRLGEQLSLMGFDFMLKLPWPLTRREILIQFSLLEYYEDGLVFVLFNTISGKEDLCKETDGFSNDELPKPDKAVRVGLLGGIAFQKVSETKSFLRLILDMDLTLNYVPQSAINFITGKLSGTAFKFYLKWVISILKEEAGQSKIMRNPMCLRIRDALYPNRSPNKVAETSTLLQDDSELHNDDCDDESSSVYESVIGWGDSVNSDDGDDAEGVDMSTSAMIENASKSLEDVTKAKTDHRQVHHAETGFLNNNKVQPSPLVGKTLGTLQEAVSSTQDGSARTENNESRQLVVETQKVTLNKEALSASPKHTVVQKASLKYSSIIKLSDFRSAKPNKSSEQDHFNVASYIIQNRTIQSSSPSKGTHQNQQQIIVVDANYVPKGEKSSRKKSRKWKHWAFGCMYPASEQSV